MGRVIQENYHADCRNLNPPCPSFYNSAEAYKCKFIKYRLKVVYSEIRLKQNTTNHRLTCNKTKVSMACE